jgi:hypothetical protein
MQASFYDPEGSKKCRAFLFYRKAKSRGAEGVGRRLSKTIEDNTVHSTTFSLVIK